MSYPTLFSITELFMFLMFSPDMDLEFKLPKINDLYG